MRLLSLAIAALLQITPLTSAELIEDVQASAAAASPLRRRTQAVQRKSNTQQQHRRQKGQEDNEAHIGLYSRRQKETKEKGEDLAGHSMSASMSMSMSMSTSMSMSMSMQTSMSMSMPSAAECPSELTKSTILIEGSLTLYSEVVGNILCARLESETESWISFGISPAGTMEGGEAIAGNYAYDSVQKYILSNDDTARVVPMADEKQTLMNTSITQGDGKTVMEFAKYLQEDGENEIFANGENTFLWAVGSSNDPGYHASRDDFTVDFGTTEETTTEAPPTTADAILETTTEATIEATVDAPPEATEAPPATEPPAAMFGKSGKSALSLSISLSESKAKKESPIPKAQKTTTNPMSMPDEAVDSKSGKALADLDAKAEKASYAAEADGSKASKASSNSKSGKGSKMEETEEVIPGSKGGKAKTLFAKHHKVN